MRKLETNEAASARTRKPPFFFLTPASYEALNLERGP